MRSFLFMAVAALVLSGCQTIPYTGEARFVKRVPGSSGVIAVPINPQQADRDRATELMVSNCGSGNYKVASEEEYVTGQTVQSDAYNNGSPVYREHHNGITFGPPEYSDTHVQQTVAQTKEWRITFACLQDMNNPPARPAAGPPPPMPTPTRKNKK